MKKLVSQIIKFRWLLIAIISFLIIISAFLIPKTTINYDLADYLPDDSVTKESLEVFENEFDSHGSVQVMVSDITILDAITLKHTLMSIDGIYQIPWIDELISPFYKNGNALFNIEFTNSDYDLETGDTLNEIESALSNHTFYISGGAKEAYDVRNVVQDEFFKILLVIVPLCFLILLIASRSYIEPALYLIVIGVAIVFNLGTNFIFPNVSFITHSMASVLQLAISLDYSLFVFHRFLQERDLGNDTVESIKIAMVQSFKSVFASGLTTISGFLALIFMRYRIGGDMGLVLAKGIVFSLISVVFVLPVLIFIFSKLIDKTRHRPFIPSFGGISKIIIKLKYVFLGLAIVLLVVSFFAQSNNSFIYSDMSSSKEKISTNVDTDIITENFGVYNPVILLLPHVGDKEIEEFRLTVSENEYINNTQIALSENYLRFVVFLSDDQESTAMFDTIKFLRENAQESFPDNWYMVGKSSAIYDIRDSVTQDYNKVMLISIGAILLIVILTFKAVIIPVIIVLVIQSSIWINMAIPYFQGVDLIFIGYMIIGALQLGATIDYAILLSSRYVEARKTDNAKVSIKKAISSAGVAIAVSALILTVAGFAEGILSDIPSIREIGILLGRGGALSGLMVLFVLPALLVIFDKAKGH